MNLHGEAVLVSAFEHAYNAMVITDADFGGGGPFIQRCNPAFCKLTGYTEEELIGQSPRILQGPATDRKVIDHLSLKIRAGEFFEGSTVNYRKDGVSYVVQWNISPVRDTDGAIVAYSSIQQDITALVEANERIRILTQRLQRKTDQVSAELNSAATYIQSILPRDLTGSVSVSSRYLPARELGGDSFDYFWIDDDHLLVYLLDVSGHGIPPALLSVSLHNMLRFGNLSPASLLAPDTVLTELNRRFRMDQHGYHYFTMWCGVYQASNRTMRYSSGGSPPALVFNSGTGSTAEIAELATKSAPVGMFEDTVFPLRNYIVPPGCRILIHSDGASEITLVDGHHLTQQNFKNLIAKVASLPNWSLDEIITELTVLTPPGTFEDDFSLIRLAFD